MADLTTASTVQRDTFTLADLERLARDLEALPRPPWTLIAPDGRAWQSTDPQELLKVLARASFGLSPLGVEEREQTGKGEPQP